MTLTVAGTATSSADTMTLAAFSAQVKIPSNGCTTTVSPGGQAFSPTGGTGSINITTSPGCPWGVFNIPSWVTLTSAASGTGNGTVTYQVQPNAGPDQSGTLTVTNTSFTVEQEGTVAGLNFIGSMAHLAGQENWTTTFTLVNKSAASATARAELFRRRQLLFPDPNGSGPLTLPLAFPQLPNAPSPTLWRSFDRTYSRERFLDYHHGGSADLASAGGLGTTGGHGCGGRFRHFPPDSRRTQEAVVPMETRNASSYLLPFDNSPSDNGNLVLGIALANISAQAVTVQVVIRDDTGAADRGRTAYPAAGWRPLPVRVGRPIPGYGEYTRHHRIRYTVAGADQRAGSALHAAEQCAHDHSGAGQCRHRRRQHRASGFGRWLANHVRAG